MVSHLVDERRFDGAYLVWKLNAQGFRRSVGGSKLPYKRHETYESAAAEAARLTGLYPQSTFVILQEVSRVKAAVRLERAA